MSLTKMVCGDNTLGKTDLLISNVNELIDKAAPYSSAIWNQNSDTMTSEGVQNGVTKVHSSMRRCLLLDNGTVNYYLDSNNSALKADGTAAVLTGDDGQVMVEIPKCYVKAVYIQAGSSPIIEWSVSAEPKLGYVVHPAFTKDGNLVYSKPLGMWHYENVTKELDYIYVGAYQASVYDVSAGTYIDGLNLDSNTTSVDVANDNLASVSGKYPMVGLTRGEFRTLAANRGAGWQQLDFWTHSLLQLLYTTEYRNLNSQAAVGNGNVSVASGYPESSSLQADSPHSVAGKSNAIGNGTGALESTLRDTAWMSYRGIENFWGNCYAWCDGINILDQVSFVNNTATFVDNTSSGYTQLGVAAPATNGYIRKIQADTLSGIPSDTSGGSTIAFSDNYYTGAGWRVFAVGGAAALGGAAGAFLFAGANVSGRRNRTFGGRLVFKKNL